MTLTDIRKGKRLTTVDLAVRIGISQGYYSNLERGKRPFNNVLLKKTSKALGVPLATVREAVRSHPHDLHKLKSWMSNIKIHGLPLIKAFHYYMETTGIEVQTLDDMKLKKKMKEFVEANIGFSVLAELSENRTLLNHIREIICVDAILVKNGISNNKSITFQQ
jgi:transcriptional regulator with XRE-family HTH domain